MFCVLGASSLCPSLSLIDVAEDTAHVRCMYRTVCTYAYIHVHTCTVSAYRKLALRTHPGAVFEENVMSIDIDWETLTTGPEGLALADSIKDFIHEKFQKVELPRFIRSVHVHSFDFGKECPVVELKDICDPLPEFYAHDDDAGSEGDDIDVHHEITEVEDLQPVRHPREYHRSASSIPTVFTSSAAPNPVHHIDPRPAGLRLNLGFADHLATPPSLPRSSTPGIPGGTSNLSYFHLPLSAGLSGTQTPLAAVAGGTSFTAGWDHHGSSALSRRPLQHEHGPPPRPDSLSRPSTGRTDTNSDKSSKHPNPQDHPEPTPPPSNPPPDPMDTQIVLHISYDGTVRLSITAEILLDYPMPSFVGIPLKLNITGLSFDGVALIASLRKRAHFCFLGPEDARTLVGIAGDHDAYSDAVEVEGRDRLEKSHVGGLLREIQVESEIGRQEGGKQVLKNVGKVEKFVLEQVRRIFEDEFVWPSFWTFLV